MRHLEIRDVCIHPTYMPFVTPKVVPVHAGEPAMSNHQSRQVRDRGRHPGRRGVTELTYFAACRLGFES